jgi:hypothetical protein
VELGEVAFQVDLAAALTAVVALAYSIRSGARQRRPERETLRLQQAEVDPRRRISFLEQHR